MNGQTLSEGFHFFKSVFCSAFSPRGEYLLSMKIYDEKILDVMLNGRLQTVSVVELFQLIVDGYTPTLTEESVEDFKKLMWLTTQIFIQGDWLVRAFWSVPEPPTPKNKNPLKR